ncbi:hypothetical protein [Spirillospora sp. NPDC047279]|uniref:hypothetical protein n=1 Tax=Spirillospora sp. NPDC047279 TaxID=3155478 RepID=UPI00340DEDA6
MDGVYGPLIGIYERLEGVLRERSGAGARPVGWAAHLEAMRSFRERRVAGDWEALVRLMVDPSEARARVVEVAGGGAEVAAAREAVLADEGRVLLLAPNAETVDQVLRDLGDEVLAVRVDGVVPQADMATVMDIEPPTRPEAEPAPAGVFRGAVVRPGDAWRKVWKAEAKNLQRELLLLEQWPRDRMAFAHLQEQHERLGERLAAEIEGLTAELQRTREEAAAAEDAIGGIHADRDRLAAEEARLAEEAAGPRAEAARLHGLAEAAAGEAGEHTRVADEAYARCAAIDQQTARSQGELQEARRAEESLGDELTKARAELPRATEETERLNAAATDAEARWHTGYYRLKSAESALAAQRRKLTLGQRLHVSSMPPRIEELRAEVKAQSRQADEAAKQAREANEAAERAVTNRAGLVRFISEGGSGLAAAQAAQERLNAEIHRLAGEREAAVAAHREQAHRAAESVDRATQASMAARHAHQVFRQAEERLAAAQRSHQGAVAAAEQAEAQAATAAGRAAEIAGVLDRRSGESETELAALRAEVDAAAETEARSREMARRICGAEPDDEVLAGHQRTVMRRIEQLSAADAGPAAQALLDESRLVCGTPEAVGASPVSTSGFDTLVVVGAGRLNDADVLVGAVHASDWVLIGVPGERPPEYAEYAAVLTERDDTGHLLRGPFDRAVAGV